MNENIDLTKILKDCPKGWKFCSPIFGEVEFEKIFEHMGIGGTYRCCIPYNEETKHLVGTTDEAPEYYRYWED